MAQTQTLATHAMKRLTLANLACEPCTCYSELIGELCTHIGGELVGEGLELCTHIGGELVGESLELCTHIGGELVGEGLELCTHIGGELVGERLDLLLRLHQVSLQAAVLARLFLLLRRVDGGRGGDQAERRAVRWRHVSARSGQVRSGHSGWRVARSTPVVGEIYINERK